MVVCAVTISGCSIFPPGAFTPRDENTELVQGPPIEDVITPFDEALSCLRGKLQPEIVFAVGQIVDSTGKESFADGGTGKFVTQGAGEMVQSALFRAGVTVVNRRDRDIPVVETQWGIRDLSYQIPADFYISGSINSLDFIPGGGFSADISGAGPRIRQNRILIGLDLSMTDALTGRIVASVPLQKQIFSREMGASLGRFFGDTLVGLDAGGQEREAVHFALRQMLNLASFELLGQLMNASSFAPCKEKVSPFYGAIQNVGTGDPDALRTVQEHGASREAARQQQIAALQQATQQQAAQQEALQRAIYTARQQGAAQRNGNVGESSPQEVFFSRIRAEAVGAIDLARQSRNAETRSEASKLAMQSIRQAARAMEMLREAAERGLEGQAGDAAAVLVERAVNDSRAAADAAGARAENGAEEAPAEDEDAPAEAPDVGAPQQGQSPRPGTPEHQRLHGGD